MMKNLVEVFAKMSDNDLEEFAQLAVKDGCATQLEFFLHKAQLSFEEEE
jgi:hypothetical protein